VCNKIINQFLVIEQKPDIIWHGKKATHKDCCLPFLKNIIKNNTCSIIAQIKEYHEEVVTHSNLDVLLFSS